MAVVPIPHVAGTGLCFVLIRRYVNRVGAASFWNRKRRRGNCRRLASCSIFHRNSELRYGRMMVFCRPDVAYRHRIENAIRAACSLDRQIGSGAFGASVGNQRGIRSAALPRFDIEKESLVATATAIGLIVDAARLPTYFARNSSGIFNNWAFLLLGTAGVIVGTVLGNEHLGKSLKTFPTNRRGHDSCPWVPSADSPHSIKWQAARGNQPPARQETRQSSLFTLAIRLLYSLGSSRAATAR